MSLLAVGAVLEGQYDYCVVDGNLEDEPLAALDAKIREAGERMKISSQWGIAQPRD